MKHGPRCNATDCEPELACSRCGTARTDRAGRQDGEMIAKRPKRLWKIVAVTFMLIALGVALVPYLIWTIVGPIPSLG
jgi:hypothetical protein